MYPIRGDDASVLFRYNGWFFVTMDGFIPEVVFPMDSKSEYAVVTKSKNLCNYILTLIDKLPGGFAIRLSADYIIIKAVIFT